MTWWEALVATTATLAAAVPLGLRWLRVAQREHYLPGSVTRFLVRWWLSTPLNVTIGFAAVAALVGAVLTDLGLWFVLIAAALGAVFPVGLPARGTTSALAWTDRLKKVAFTTGGLAVLVTAVVSLIPGSDYAAGLIFGLFAIDVLVDVALVVLAPIEKRSQRKWIDKARAGMRMVGPSVVAITGSYGKTTTKEYVRRVLAASAPTVASPASFNNAMGLARTVNEHLSPGTEWFIAEMGSYGPGEIGSLCEWIPPDIAAITAIGPVHLERFGSLDTTLRSKAEITERARTVVLNVDDERLAGLADELEASGKRVVRTGVESEEVAVRVTPAEDGWAVVVDGAEVARLPAVPFPTNLALAVGIGVAAGVALDGMAEAFADSDTPDHRQSVTLGKGGFWVIDDTFNSNPAGAEAALELLAGTGTGRRVVVTPGMVELGREQASANEAFGERAAEVADDVVIVKRTNRVALRKGANTGQADVRFAPSRDEAIEWVRATLRQGDVVLYENDLPDHYP